MKPARYVADAKATKGVPVTEVLKKSLNNS
jgi:hypothetical protein